MRQRDMMLNEDMLKASARITMVVSKRDIV